MPANDCWFYRQLFENMKEASKCYDRFNHAQEPNIDDLDKAMRIHEEFCLAYDLKQEDSFNKFIEFGQSLRARQALKNIQQDNDYGI